MPVLRVEMPAKLELLLYQRMFFNIERIFLFFFYFPRRKRFIFSSQFHNRSVQKYK